MPDFKRAMSVHCHGFQKLCFLRLTSGKMLLWIRMFNLENKEEV
jgi:hypothetical protein